MTYFEIKSREWEEKLYHMVKVRLLRLGLGLQWPQSAVVMRVVLSTPSPGQMGPKAPRDPSRQAGWAEPRWEGKIVCLCTSFLPASAWIGPLNHGPEVLTCVSLWEQGQSACLALLGTLFLALPLHPR